ncbi:uncharacterized protein LOC133740451 isoform X3 [Rosa rugosa]|uniref:uncharacterized protein LOC133740451 isoform X3 n=1 Tax=Rosa rugosa TaxID=74645 RepID=UPI002B40CCDA|nr:uncharacterized protein LOC133740451 isoform X3 [Rosa rugosa]
MTTDATAIGSYSVWAIPPDDVSDRIKKVMLGLRDEFGGAPEEIEPHFPIVGSIRMTREDALNKLRTLIQSYPPGCISAFTARVDEIVARPFYYQCVCLRIHYSHQLKEISRCCSHKWGLRFPGVPYLSLLYGCARLRGRRLPHWLLSLRGDRLIKLNISPLRGHELRSSQ